MDPRHWLSQLPHPCRTHGLVELVHDHRRLLPSSVGVVGDVVGQRLSRHIGVLESDLVHRGARGVGLGDGDDVVLVREPDGFRKVRDGG